MIHSYTHRLETCSGCKEVFENKFHEERDVHSEWSVKNCTKLITTDAYGEIRFPSSYNKKAKVIFKTTSVTKNIEDCKYLY